MYIDGGYRKKRYHESGIDMADVMYMFAGIRMEERYAIDTMLFPLPLVATRNSHGRTGMTVSKRPGTSAPGLDISTKYPVTLI